MGLMAPPSMTSSRLMFPQAANRLLARMPARRQGRAPAPRPLQGLDPPRCVPQRGRGHPWLTSTALRRDGVGPR